MNGAKPERSGKGDDCCEPFPRYVGAKKGLGLGLRLRLSLSKPRRSQSKSDVCSEPSSQSQGNNLHLNPCKRQKIAAKAKELPEDILVDILMTLPVKSLVRFRCVCNSWLSLITNPRFVRRHLNYHHHEKPFKEEQADADADGCVIKVKADNWPPWRDFSRYEDRLDSEDLEIDYTWSQRDFGKPYDYHNYEEEEEEEEEGEGEGEGEEEEEEVEEEEEEIDCPPILQDAIDFRVSAPCDGLLCGVVKRVERVSLILWNPSLREYVELAAPPHPKIFRSVNGIGYNPHADEYKVVRIVPGPDFVEYKPVVYVLGLKTNLWKKIPSIPPISLLGHSEISINGSIYWTDQSGSLVIRFDLVTLKFSLVAQFFVKHWHKTLLMNIGGSLCVAALGSKRDHFVRVWSLSPNNTWKRLLTLRVLSSFISICMLPHFTWSSAFLLRILFRKLFEFYTNYYGIGFSPGDKPYYEDLKQAYCYKESLLSPRHLLCHPSESEPSSL